jgi:hypothetical protein
MYHDTYFDAVQLHTLGHHAGTIALGEKMLNLSTDYITAHAILGVQRLSTCVAVPIVTSAKAVATLGSDTVFRIKETKVLTANGQAPEDPGDCRYCLAF